MALHITNPDVEQKVRNFACAQGTSITDAIGMAVDRADSGVVPFSRQPERTVEEILAMVRSYHLQPINEDLTEDEILGYGPDGFCE